MKHLELCQKAQKWTHFESVTSPAMPLVGLRVVIILFRLLSLLSTNSVVVASLDLQTSPAVVATQSLDRSFLPKPQNDLNNWREGSAIIIHHLPGLLTKHVGGTFTLKFLDPKGTKIVKKPSKEYGKDGKISTKQLSRLCKLAKRIARAEFNQMKSQMRKERVRGFLTRMFSSVNIPKWYKQGRNKIALKKIRSLDRHCLSWTL